MANIISQFTSSIRSGVAPLTVNFTNTSTGPYNSVMWDFGDGSKSSLINPSHQFISDGVFQVTLTIYDELSGSSQTNTTISVFADDDYSTSSTTQQALFASKRFGVGQVAVKKTLTDGSTLQTEFPLSSTTNPNITLTNLVIPMSGYKGTGVADNVISVINSGTSETLYTHLVDSGYTGYLGLFMHTGLTGADTTSAGHQLFMYKITDQSRPLETLTLDRNTPLISGDTAIGFNSIALLTLSGTVADTMGNSAVYKSVQTSQAVDSLETLDIPSMYAQNSSATGIMKYLEGKTSLGDSKMFVHPTYTGWNTVELWKPSTIRLSLPYVLWHSKGSAGVTLIDSNTTYREDETNLKYSNLSIEDDGTVVGRVFYEKKMIVIDDKELQASLSYLSNRNYTLPDARVSTTSTVDGTGGLKTGTTYYVTYRVRDGVADNYTGGTTYGTGYIQPLHCRYIQELTPSKDGYKFRIQAPASLWHTTDRTASSDTGFTASIVDVLVGSATTTQNIGNANWYVMENVGVYSSLTAGVEVAYTSGAKTAADFTTLSISGNTNLTYGDDPVTLGYFSATSQSTIYKMSATCIAKNNEFNTTQNATYCGTTNESVYISEVALYNENNELLMTGKLNTPIEKNDKKFVTVKMELDL